jgi:ATP/ADP translocase
LGALLVDRRLIGIQGVRCHQLLHQPYRKEDNIMLVQHHLHSIGAMVPLHVAAPLAAMLPHLLTYDAFQAMPSTALFSLSGGGDIETSVAAPLWTTPEGKSVVCMAIAMSLHYLGYSLARSITLSLFSSAVTGYAGHASAFPLANAFISPCSLLLLLGYNYILERSGPRNALIQSTLFSAMVINTSAFCIAASLKSNLMLGSIPIVKLISGPLFVFRESYVQLLTSQYWSFMASALTPNQSARYFGPIAGLTSITSAVAGYLCGPLVRRVGLTQALFGTGLTLYGSLVAAAWAYRIAKQHGFEPVQRNKKKSLDTASEHGNVLQKATKLFQRVPVLRTLFMEILASQGLAMLLNSCFIAALGQAIPNDNERAGWVGQFYSTINIITMFLQFGVMPYLMTFLEPKDLWRLLPIVSLLFTGYQACERHPSLFIVSASLMVMKVSEYSVRRVLDEMIFVPLDYESRFVGKEVIGVFGYRFGKSLMSLLLSAITAVVPTFGVQSLSVLSTGVCVGWLGTAWQLSNLVPTRAEAEAAHQKSKSEEKKKHL